MAKEIKVALTLDTKNFDSKLSKAKGSMAGFTSGSNKAGGSLLGLATKVAAVVAPVLAVGKGFDQLGKSLGVAAKFEDVQVTLSNIVGSAEGGAAALAKIRDVAKDLPVSFEELAASAPGLATVSDDIGALEDNIRKTADIAATFGIPFDVAAGQLQRAFSAGAGAADVFREKGVLAAAGFEAGVSYSVEETIAKLDELSEKVKGASEDLNKTFSGAVNQAGDAVTDFQAEIGNAFKPEVTALLTDLTNKFRENEEQVLAFATAIGRNALKGLIAFAKGVATGIDLVLSIGQTAKRIGKGIKDNFGDQIRAVADGVVKAFGFIIESVSLVGIGLGKLISLTTGVNDVEEFFNNVNDAAANLRREGLSVIDDTSTALGDFIPVTTARDAVNQLVDDFTAGGQQIRDDIKKTNDAAKGLGDNLAINLTNGAIDAKAALAALTTDTAKLAVSLSNLLGAPFAGKVTESELLAIFKKNLEESGDVMNALSEESGKLGLALGIIQGIFQLTVPSLQEYNNTVKFLLDNYEELGFTLPQVTALINKLNKEFENDEGIRNFIETLESATKSLSTDLATAFLEGQKAGDAFKNFFKTMIKQIIADILRLAIIQPILGAILGPFGFAFGSGGSIVRKKQSGGSVMQRKPYIVGEAGPELFVPGASGTIIPNGGFGGTSVTYNINAVDSQSFEMALARDPSFVFAVTEAGRRKQPGRI